MNENFQDGKYTILHEVGQGGMAVVYKAIDTALDREVAIKVLHPHLSNRADSRMRLQREAKAVAKLHHPNILEIYDYSGMDCDESYIVTEYIRGETLKDFTDRHTPSLPEIGAMMVLEVTGALAHAHGAGIIHRDIKPENIMIRDDGVLKLMDFGIAQIVDMQAMTVTGALVGSPAHMSPEHVEGKPLDYRADVFSVGTMLYFLCAGRLPFDSPSPHALLRQILEAQYDDPRMHNPAISRRLSRIITKCLARDPDDRYATIEALQNELQIYLRDLGFEDPTEELVLYFEDPATVEAGLTQRLVESLMEGAQDAAHSGKVAQALEYYNQVLALQGDREDALVQVQRLSTSRSRRARARWLAVAAAALCGVAAIVWLLLPGTNLSAPEPNLTQHAASMPTPVAVAAAAVVEPKAGKADVAAVEAAPAAVVPAPFERQVRATEDQTDAQHRRAVAVLDGATVAKIRMDWRKQKAKERRAAKRPDGPDPEPVAAGPNPGKGPAKGLVRFSVETTHGGWVKFESKRYEVGYTGTLHRAPGRYSVLVGHPDCTNCTRTASITLDGQRERYIVKFKMADAHLRLTGLPPNARVTLQGKTHKAGEFVRVAMRQPQDSFMVEITAPGYKTARRRVTLTVGEKRSQNAQLTLETPAP